MFLLLHVQKYDHHHLRHHHLVQNHRCSPKYHLLQLTWFDVGFLNYELNTCGKKPLKNEKIDTVSIAREKFPGQSVSLDALCKRFAIDNTQREKHSATVDTELLARVYIELMDARELSLDLNNSVEVKNSPVTFNTEKIKNRNLPSRLSEKEKELHQSFIQTLGKNSIWNKISQSSE